MSMSPARTVADLGERAIIDRIGARAPASPAFVTVGIGDDAAVLEAQRNRAEVVTTDVLVEGVHFDRAYVPPGAIGHKALAVNLSDLAAMGAEPRAALLSLVLPASMTVEDFDEMIGGFMAVADRYRVARLGLTAGCYPARRTAGSGRRNVRRAPILQNRMRCKLIFDR